MLSYIQFSNSLSEVFFLTFIIYSASSPTGYLISGSFEVIAFRIASATSLGGEELLSIIFPNPFDTFSIMSAYGDSGLGLVSAVFKFSTMFVFITPGSIITILIPNSLSSYLIDSDSPSNANLVATYAEKTGIPTLPAPELTFTIVPFLCFLIIGNTSLITLTTPKKLVSNCSLT